MIMQDIRYDMLRLSVRVEMGYVDRDVITHYQE